MSEDLVKVEQKQMSHALASSPTNRTLEANLRQLDITLDDLGKTVLDIGSGRGERFAREAAKHGIRVFSLNPQLADLLDRQKRKSYIEKDEWITYSDQKRTATGLAQSLPYADKTFDTVISAWAVPFNLAPEDYSVSFKEIYRVLKPGGRAFMGPVSEVQINGVEEALNKARIKFEMKSSPVDAIEYRNLVITKPH